MTAEVARMAAFHALSREEQVAAVRRLAADRYSLPALAAATGLSVEAVASVLRELVADAPADYQADAVRTLAARGAHADFIATALGVDVAKVLALLGWRRSRASRASRPSTPSAKTACTTSARPAPGASRSRSAPR